MGNLLLVVNYGGPLRGREGEYLRKLFSDPLLLPLPSPIRKIVANLIALFRREETSQILSAVGGTSPFLKQTFEQAKALGKLLEGWEVRVAMRYSDPLLEEVLRDIDPERFENIVVLPLFPQYSVATWGSVKRVVENSPLKGKVKFVEPFYGCENFVLGWVEAIEKTLKGLEKPFLLFSAHGLPQYLVRRYGDPYPKQMEESAKLIAQRLGLPYKVSYQSRLGPVRWLEPSTERAMEELRMEGVRDLVVVPISFVSENTETLQEIDIDYRLKAVELGFNTFRRVEIPHLSPRWLRCWVDVVLATIKI